MEQANGTSPLADALLRYVDARRVALLEARRSLGINELDARALVFIAEHPGARPGLLAEFLGITSAGVTTLVDRLVQRGAVQREVDAKDRRVNRLSITVDLTRPPWSALTRFDKAFDVAASSTDGEEAERFARTLNAWTDAASAASA